MHDKSTGGYTRTTIFILSLKYIFTSESLKLAYLINLLTLALLTVNLPMSTHPTVLYTKKRYGLIIFVPIKKKK